ncbi:hypothetical protein [Pseudolactococcus reticulitermitis]|nr:hypothetical protein [Lactococcus reticulitermitis]
MKITIIYQANNSQIHVAFFDADRKQKINRKLQMLPSVASGVFPILI